MSIRIHELARRHGVDSRDLLALLKERGYVSTDTKSVSSTVSKIYESEIDKEFATGLSLNPAREANALDVARVPGTAIEATHAMKPPALEQTHDTNELEYHSGPEFERAVGLLLEEHIPHSFLASVPIFRPDDAILPKTMGTEIDFLLHGCQGKQHYIFLVECKACPIVGPDGTAQSLSNDGKWFAERRDERDPIYEQLKRQRLALTLNMEPLEEYGSFKYWSLVIAGHNSFPPNAGFNWEESHDSRATLFSFRRLGAQLKNLLEKPGFKFFRIQQSEVLRRIRMGLPVPQLGHPELPHALEYSKRCRQFIDGELFQYLAPATGRWMINGSAGMGKSMLLAYTLLALVTDMKIGRLGGWVIQPQSFAEDWDKAGVPPIVKRRIWAVAQTEMQVEALRRAYHRFTAYLSRVDPYNQHLRVTPQFRLSRDLVGSIDCNILLVDEAHDLPPIIQQRITEWWKAGENSQDPDKRRYLVVACDRYQKLRMVGPDARIIEGLPFKSRSCKLDRNYRNPFAVYAGSIALLFRWFAPSGPKIIPTKTDFAEGFSFKVLSLGETATDDQVWLSERNDAHPANNWNHIIAEFPRTNDAYLQLQQAKFSAPEVLWLRFGAEDPDFNYQHLSAFTYHPARAADAQDTMDRYVKGQEYSVVVLEGLPDGFEWSEGESAAEHSQLWTARRLYYLAASRATVFLYFILPGNIRTDTRKEFAELFRQLSESPRAPLVFGKVRRQSPSGKFWELRFRRTLETMTLRNYLDLTDDEQGVTHNPSATSEVAKIVSQSPVSFPAVSPPIVPADKISAAVVDSPIPTTPVSASRSLVNQTAKCSFDSTSINELASGYPTPATPNESKILSTANELMRPISLEASLSRALEQTSASSSAPTRPSARAGTTGSLAQHAQKRSGSSRSITLHDLARHLEKKPFELAKKALELGWLVSVDTPLDRNVVNGLCKEFGKPTPATDAERLGQVGPA